MRRKGASILWVAALLGIAGSLSLSCSRNFLEGMCIAVELPGKDHRTFTGARLIAVDPESTDTTTTVLTGEFHSAASPALSNSGRYLVFSGKMLQDDPWQIWLMDLRKKSTFRVTDLQEDCTDPVFLPDGKIVFSREGLLKGKEIASLYKCNRDGSDLQQLTFHPNRDHAASILKDGRILYASQQQYPDARNPVFLVTLPDGSKSGLYYPGFEGSYPLGRGRETEDGSIYFIEKGAKGEPDGRLVTIHQNRPLHSRRRLSDGLDGSFRSVYPVGGDRCLVSYRPSATEAFALYAFDLRERKLLGKLYGAAGDVIDPILVAARQRPRILPSAVDPENPTGLMMSQDINHSALPVRADVGSDTMADRIRIQGLDGPLSEVKVAEDGSFYLRIDSDLPVRFETLNSRGEVIRGPSAWIWLRPNERRGCVGCHADPELAPENRVPLAVKHPPVIVSTEQKEISKLEATAK